METHMSKSRAEARLHLEARLVRLRPAHPYFPAHEPHAASARSSQQKTREHDPAARLDG